MSRINIYAAITAVVFFGGHVVNYVPEIPEPKTYTFSPEIKTGAFVSTKVEPEVKVYKKNEQLSPKELKSILKQVGFKGERLREAWAIAMKESTGRPMSHNRNASTGDNSYGLFQINMIGSLGPARLKKYKLDSNEDLFDPIVNAKIAYKMSDGGQNWSAWNGLSGNTARYLNEFPN